MTTLPVLDAPEVESTPRRISRRARGRDAVFVNGSRAIGASVLVITGGIGVFLLSQSFPTLKHYGLHFFTGKEWNPDTNVLGIAAILVGTFEVAMVALLIAFPFALAMALYITEYAPVRLRSTLIAAVDLMAAVPSIVYGLWGFFLVEPHATTFSIFLQRNFHWIQVPFHTWGIHFWGWHLGNFAPFKVGDGTGGVADPNAAVPDLSRYTASAFIAGVVVSMMVMPMACSVMRQVFSQTPEGEKEGALALGATTWGMVRSVVLPFGRGGIIGGTMLALGRALGETVAVLLIISPQFVIKSHILENGTDTVAALIAAQFGEATGLQLSALLTDGFVLFVITLLVNTAAAVVVSRSRSGAET